MPAVLAAKFYSEAADDMKPCAYLVWWNTRSVVHIFYWLQWILDTDRLCCMPGTNRASGLHSEKMKSTSAVKGRSRCAFDANRKKGG